MSNPLEKLRHHVSGAIERGEAEAFTEKVPDTLKLPNVARHILNNPDIPNDPMYRKQIDDAIRYDEAHWDLERAGRSWDQQSFALFLQFVVAAARACKGHGDSQIHQAYEQLDKAAQDFAGVPVLEIEAKMPQWMAERAAQVAQWRHYFFNPMDRIL